MLGHVHLQGRHFLFSFFSFCLFFLGQFSSVCLVLLFVKNGFSPEMYLACTNSLVLHDVLGLFRCQPQYLKNALLTLDIVVGSALVRKTNGSYLQIKHSLNIQVSWTTESIYLILRFRLCETFIVAVFALTVSWRKLCLFALLCLFVCLERRL